LLHFTSWGKGGRCLWLTTYHPCSAETSRKSGTLTYPEPLGPPRPVAGDLYFILYFTEVLSKLDYVSVIFNYAISTDDDKFEHIQWQLAALYYIRFFPHTPIMVMQMFWSTWNCTPYEIQKYHIDNWISHTN